MLRELSLSGGADVAVDIARDLASDLSETGCYKQKGEEGGGISRRILQLALDALEL